MTASRYGRIAAIGALLLLLEIVLVAFLGNEPSAGAGEAAAVLAFIGGAAVAIERVIEAGWTLVGGVAGTYWPLNTISNQVNTMLASLDNALKPFHKDLVEKVQAVDAEEIAKIKKQYDDLRQLRTSNQHIQLLNAVASTNAKYLKDKYGDKLPELDLDQSFKIVEAMVKELQDFLGAFKDNPGRRLISIYVGALLGLAIAGIFGLDVFQAVLGTVPVNANARVILTGLIIGLGSNPTHEVIRVLQEYKKKSKGENTKSLG